MIFENNSLENFNNYKDKKIICFGTHGYLKDLFDYLDLYNRVECFCVTPPYNKDKIKIGNATYKVYPISSLNLYSPDEYIILITEDNISSVIRFLNKQIYLEQRFHIFHKFFYSDNNDFLSKFMLNSDNYFHFVDMALAQNTITPQEFGFKDKKSLVADFVDTINNSNKIIIPTVNFDITTKCTLKCKDCMVLTAHYTCEKSRNIPLNTVLKDLKTFLNAVDYVVNLNLIGGETFLYPDLDVIIEYLLQSKKIGSISIMTNLSFVPKEKVFKLLSNPKIILGISIYEENKNAKAMMKNLVDNKIKFSARSFIGAKDWIPGSSDSIMKWSPMRNFSSRNISDEQMINEYLMCGARVCRAVMGGKLFACQVSERMYDLDISKSDTDYIELIDDAELGEKIQGVYKQFYCKACNHCHMADLSCKSIPGGQQ